MSRQDLLNHPEVRCIPAEWLADKTDAEIQAYIDDIASRRAATAVEQARQEQDRKSWRKPEWLIATDEVEQGRRAYRTEDGYTAIAGNLSGRGRSDKATGWHLRGPGLKETIHVATLRRMAEVIEWARAQA
jgi:hypothetical protein